MQSVSGHVCVCVCVHVCVYMCSLREKIYIIVLFTMLS